MAPDLRDSVFAPPAAPPFPAGTSPFRQKGNAYLGDRRYLDEVVPGGFQAAVAGIPDAGTRAFFAQQFRASEWYDAYPGALIEQSAARLTGSSYEQHRIRTGRWHADDATSGLYRALLKVVSNENVALWAPRIAGVYFEFGKTESRVVGPQDVVATRRGTPRELVQWQAWVMVGFGEATLRAAGGRSVTAFAGNLRPDGHAHGRELWAFDVSLRWT